MAVKSKARLSGGDIGFRHREILLEYPYHNRTFISSHSVSMLETVLQEVVEQLCKEGCQQVNSYIHEIEAGKLPENMQTLNNGDRQKVLSELKSIMAVYERCDIKK